MRHTSGPTITSERMQSPSTSSPVANSQWTISAGGSTTLLEIHQQRTGDDQGEEEPGSDDEQRRLDGEPPEALVVRVQDRQPVRLNDRPDEPGRNGDRTECGDCLRASRARDRLVATTCIRRFHLN